MFLLEFLKIQNSIDFTLTKLGGNLIKNAISCFDNKEFFLYNLRSLISNLQTIFLYHVRILCNVLLNFLFSTLECRLSEYYFNKSHYSMTPVSEKTFDNK